MAEAIFYERPVPLNRETHKNLRVKPLENAGFAAKTHSVPLTVADFGPAAHDYAIVFGGNSLAEAVPMAILGLQESKNAFVDANGQWAPGTYIPTFVRRYPFVPGEKNSNGDATVFLDEAYPGFGTEEGELLFDATGAETETLQNVVRVLNDFQDHFTRTQAFANRLRELDLLEPRTLQAGDGNVLAHGFFVVNEDRLRKLDEKTAGELLADGSLGWIYAHLVSLANIDRLQARTKPSTGSEPAPAHANPKPRRKKQQ